MGCATSSGAAGRPRQGSPAMPPTCAMLCGTGQPDPSPASLHPSAGGEGCGDGTPAATAASGGGAPAAAAVAEEEPPVLLGSRGGCGDRSPPAIPGIGAGGLSIPAIPKAISLNSESSVVGKTPGGTRYLFPSTPMSYYTGKAAPAPPSPSEAVRPHQMDAAAMMWSSAACAGF